MLRDIFDEASEIADQRARQSFVTQACAGNEELRRRVDELLGAHDTAGNFLQGELPSDDGAVEPMPVETIRRYRLIEKLGEGGCGVVYLAEQQEPVKRRVALKVIKLGMDTRSVIARFEAERQALAMMDHPNIAKVLDSGATELGRPYFVMELVGGVRITEYCDQHKLSTRDRLALFIEVCHAVQHAHQKGIIHRDLKPSNILVSNQGGRPVPKVIDFGIAKATTGVELTDKTLFTQFELLLGTPAYMSPEQAELGGFDIDTRSDIYGLGVLLYELLTGRTPFDTQSVLLSGLDALRRTIRESEPTRPSTRLRGLTAVDLLEVAQRRQAEPLKLLSLVRGDLDWIVLKAMEKDRARRYVTANALAADVQRHLDHEPVKARPPSGIDVFFKWVRRNRGLCVAGGAVTLALLAGFGASTVMFFKERRARREADAAQRIAEEQRAAADDKAEESRQRLVRLNVSTGNRLVDDYDLVAALPWFVEALGLDAGNAAREDVHRRRIAAVLRAAPRLAQFWMHGSLVNSAEFSPDGQKVVTSSLDHYVRVWEVETGQLIGVPVRLETDGAGALFSPDGQSLLALDESGALRVWDGASRTVLIDRLSTTAPNMDRLAFADDGRSLVVPRTNRLDWVRTRTGADDGRSLEITGRVELVRMSADGRRLAAGVPGRSVFIWDLQADPPVGRLLPHTDRVRWMAFNGDGSRLATITHPELTLWDPTNGQPVWTIRPGGVLMDCRFSPDGKRVATASWDGHARVFDAGTGLPVGDSMRHRVGVGDVAFSPDGRWLATASWDSTARLWDAGSGDPASTSLRHAGYVSTARFSPDGRRLVTASQDRTARLWELGTNQAARLVLRHSGSVNFARFSPDGLRVITGGCDGAVQVWDALTGQKRLRLSHAGCVTDGDWSADGRRIVTATDRGMAQVWDAEDGRTVGSAVRHEKQIGHVEFRSDGKAFLTASDDGTARVWDATTGQPLTPALSHARSVTHAAFSPDGRLVVTSSLGRQAQIWDGRTGARFGPPLNHLCDVRRAVFSRDGRRVVTAPSDVTQLPRAAQMWEVETGQPVGLPLGHLDGVLFAEFSPDGRRVATSGEDKAAVIWEATTGRRLTPALSHGSYVLQARFSPDSRLLLTVSSDATARVWDAATGEAVTPPLRHGAIVNHGTWSPDGREVITACDDGVARVWNVASSRASFDELRWTAELLSGHRIMTGVGTVPLSAAELRERWEALQGSRAK